MFKEYFILFLLTHIVGDYYLQTTKMSEKKSSSIKWVLFHCFLYSVATLVILIPVMTREILILGSVVAGIHSIIDIAKYFYVKNIDRKKAMTKVKDRNLFFLDQSIHIFVLVMISYFAVLFDLKMHIGKIFVQSFDIFGIDKFTFVCWLVTLLIIHKPINIAITKILAIYKPEQQHSGSKNENNAGRIIGTIERIIILIFISIGQYSAIGLVLTAKSIARYDKIAKEKDFAEYYLLGTLISTLSVIVVSFLV